MLLIIYIFKVFRMTVLILIFSFMIAMTTQTIGDLFNDFTQDDDEENFTTVFLDPSMSISRRITLQMYYSFTSLSTVGFGDIHPISDVERVIQSCILLLGVASFTYIIHNFLLIVSLYD